MIKCKTFYSTENNTWYCPLSNHCLPTYLPTYGGFHLGSGSIFAFAYLQILESWLWKVPLTTWSLNWAVYIELL